MTLIFVNNTSLAAKGALANRLQRRTAAPPAKSKMAARGPQNGRGVFGRSKQLSLNKFFDPSTPSMRKLDDGGKPGEKGEKNDVHSGNLHLCQLTNHLDCRLLVPKP